MIGTSCSLIVIVAVIKSQLHKQPEPSLREELFQVLARPSFEFPAAEGSRDVTQKNRDLQNGDRRDLSIGANDSPNRGL